MIYKTFFSLMIISSFILSSAGNALSTKAKQNLQTLLKTRSCIRCDLRGLDLNRYDLSGTDLHEAELSQCNFTLANLSGANLSGAKLQGAILHGTDLGNANLAGADFRNAQGASAYIAGANTKGIIATGEFATLFEKQITTVNALSSSHKESKESTTVTSSEIDPPSSIVFPSYPQQSVSADIPPKKKSIERLRANKKKKLTTQQTQSYLTSAMMKTESTKAKMLPKAPSSVIGIRQIHAAPRKKLATQQQTEVNIIDEGGPTERIRQDKKKHLLAEMSATPTPKTVSTSAAGGGIIFSENQSQKQKVTSSFISPQTGIPTALQQENITKLRNGKRCYKCNFSKLDFARANLNRADLEGSNFYGCNLQHVDFSGANLKGVNFQGADLRGANLKNADLYKAHLGSANLRGAKLQGALLDGTYMKGVIGLGQ